MKIFVKTLKCARFEIQVNPEDSVADVKKNIETVLGVTAAEQVLIHKGKLLKDETTLEANNVSEKSTIGVMKRSTGTSTSSASLKPQVHATPPSSTPAASEATSATETETSYVASERVSERNIQKILEVVGRGWGRDMVTSALYLAYDDIDTALEYLYFDLPEQSEDPYITEEGTQDQTHQEPEEEDIERLFDFFNTPEHDYLRALVRSDPRIVKDYVEFLEEQDPLVFQLIQYNKALFLHLLLEVEGGTCGREGEQGQEIQADQTNEPNNGGDGGNQVGASEETKAEQPQTDQTNKPNNGDGGNQVGESKVTEVEVATPEDNELIEQLEALGFERGDAVGEYFASNKNVQVAANRLLDDNHESQE